MCVGVGQWAALGQEQLWGHAGSAEPSEAKGASSGLGRLPPLSLKAPGAKVDVHLHCFSAKR